MPHRAAIAVLEESVAEIRDLLGGGDRLAAGVDGLRGDVQELTTVLAAMDVRKADVTSVRRLRFWTTLAVLAVSLAVVVAGWEAYTATRSAQAVRKTEVGICEDRNKAIHAAVDRELSLARTDPAGAKAHTDSVSALESYLRDCATLP